MEGGGENQVRREMCSVFFDNILDSIHLHLPVCLSQTVPGQAAEGELCQPSVLLMP